MPTREIVRPFARFPIVQCQGCKTEMALKETRPLLYSSDLIVAVYRCAQCGTTDRREYQQERAAS